MCVGCSSAEHRSMARISLFLWFESISCDETAGFKSINKQHPHIETSAQLHFSYKG